MSSKCKNKTNSKNTNNKTRQKKDIQETGWNTTLSERMESSEHIVPLHDDIAISVAYNTMKW